MLDIFHCIFNATDGISKFPMLVALSAFEVVRLFLTGSLIYLYSNSRIFHIFFSSLAPTKKIVWFRFFISPPIAAACLHGSFNELYKAGRRFGASRVRSTAAEACAKRAISQIMTQEAITSRARIFPRAAAEYRAQCAS